MEKGKYGQNNIDFKKYEMSRVNLSFWSDNYASIWGCGPSAASLLTGINPQEISKLNHDKRHFPDSLMVKFLTEHNFQVTKLTIANMTNSEFVENNLNTKHLLLLSQMYAKNMATWVVLLKLKFIVHLYDIQRLLADEFISRPILSGYLLYKKSWK